MVVPSPSGGVEYEVVAMAQLMIVTLFQCSTSQTTIISKTFVKMYGKQTSAFAMRRYNKFIEKIGNLSPIEMVENEQKVMLNFITKNLDNCLCTLCCCCCVFLTRSLRVVRVDEQVFLPKSCIWLCNDLWSYFPMLVIQTQLLQYYNQNVRIHSMTFPQYSSSKLGAHMLP